MYWQNIDLSNILVVSPYFHELKNLSMKNKNKVVSKRIVMYGTEGRDQKELEVIQGQCPITNNSHSEDEGLFKAIYIPDFVFSSNCYFPIVFGRLSHRCNILSSWPIFFCTFCPQLLLITLRSASWAHPHFPNIPYQCIVSLPHTTFIFWTGKTHICEMKQANRNPPFLTNAITNYAPPCGHYTRPEFDTRIRCQWTDGHHDVFIYLRYKANRWLITHHYHHHHHYHLLYWLFPYYFWSSRNTDIKSAGIHDFVFDMYFIVLTIIAKIDIRYF